jgi:hypothetical protein
MDVQAILTRARSDDVPANWNVWPLRRDMVARDIWTWALIAAFGLLLLVWAVRAMVPDNFDGEAGKEVISVIFLSVVGCMAFGALYLFLADFQRLRLWGEYLLIMTPDDFVKVEPHRITHVPMDQIDDITLKGAQAQHDAAPADIVAQSFGGRVMGLIVRKPKVSALLIFRDRRTNREVIVGRDNSFDDLAALDYVLRLHVDAKGRARRR